MSWKNIIKYYDWEEHDHSYDAVRVHGIKGFLQYSYYTRDLGSRYTLDTMNHEIENRDILSGKTPIDEELKNWIKSLKDPKNPTEEEIENAEKMGLELEWLWDIE